jgi:calcineurin-like phosphoesterase family protein
MDYFSSDFHLGHANVIRFDKRPYENVEQMDREIIKHCMSILKSGDNFYYLGDFAFGHISKIKSYLETLHSSGANLFFIKGNHDHNNTVKLYEKYGTYLGEQSRIISYDQDIILNHYCMLVWNRSHHGSWHLYGHSHHSLPIWVDAKKLDVGWNGYYKLLKFIDHHRK